MSTGSQKAPAREVSGPDKNLRVGTNCGGAQQCLQHRHDGRGLKARRGIRCLDIPLAMSGTIAPSGLAPPPGPRNQQHRGAVQVTPAGTRVITAYRSVLDCWTLDES